MSLSNHRLFEMINASAGTADAWAWLGLSLAYGAIWLVGALFFLLWRRTDAARRQDIVVVAVAAASALMLSQLCCCLWFQPRPLDLHMGIQLNPSPMRGGGMLSDEVAVLLAMGLSSLATRQLAIFGFPLLTLALLVGWSLVYTGEHFPYDVVASLPVAVVCAVLSVRRVKYLPHGQ